MLWRAWGRLLRLSLAPSAAADAAVGLLLGASCWPADRRVLLQIAASLCVYHGGLALNDWRDREHDARTRPARPLPSGSIPPRQALLGGIGLLLLGPFLAAWVALPAAVCLSAVAAAAALYDLWGRGAWLGPSLLGFCRAGNLAAGMLAGASLVQAGTPAAARFIPALWYGAYVFAVSRLGRLEDGEDQAQLQRTARARLVPIVLLLAGSAGLPLGVWDSSQAGSDLSGFEHWIAWGARPLALAAVLGACWGLAACLRSKDSLQRPQVERCMGMALRRLLVMQLCFALLAAEAAARANQDPLPMLLVGAGCLLGYPLAFGLRRLFPPS